MKIGVLVKQVPEMDKVKFDPEKGVVNRKSAGTEVNPFDLNALETAVRLRKSLGGEVIALSMGPPFAREAVRDVISRGADDGILLNDKSFAGSDTWSTSFILSCALKKLGGLDLILTGVMSVDGDTAQVGPQVAEFLDIPSASFVSEIKKISKKEIEVVAEAFNGSYLKKLKLPALISVTKDINTPRLPRLKDKIEARKTDLKVWGLKDIGENISPNEVGAKGSPTRVRKIVVPPPAKRKGQIYEKDQLGEGIEKLTGLFRELRLLEG